MYPCESTAVVLSRLFQSLRALFLSSLLVKGCFCISFLTSYLCQSFLCFSIFCFVYCCSSVDAAKHMCWMECFAYLSGLFILAHSLNPMFSLRFAVWVICPLMGIGRQLISLISLPVPSISPLRSISIYI